MLVKVKKLHKNAVVPTYAKPGDAGLDLTATETIQVTETHITYGTGLAFEIPEGYVGLVYPRSSIRKYDLRLTNSVGVIDSGYRGEVQATFDRIGRKLQNYGPGDRIAQIIIMPHPLITLVETEELSDSERGTGGFGSTGIW
jgi:dUTP pyrophosphatase